MPNKDNLVEIIERCKKNNRIAQRAIYELFSKRLFVVCLRYSTDYSEAEDMLQEGFVKLFSKMEKYNHSGSFGGWASRLISNNCIDIIRRKPNLYALTESHENSLETHTLDALDSLIGEDLINVIQTLPVGYRTVFNMYVVEGYAHKEIAEKLNISPGTSKSQLNRARKLLQKKLEEIKTYESLKMST